MTPVHLNLSKELQQFVNGQVEAGQFDGPAGYIETLIERAQKGKEKLEALFRDWDRALAGFKERREKFLLYR